MNVEECLNEGLLKKEAPDIGKARASLEMAEHKLEIECAPRTAPSLSAWIAQTEQEHEIYESAIMSAYVSMFHSARALLFKDGYKERSHYAVWVYLAGRYSNKIERRYLNELNSLRLVRHELMYGIEKPKEAQEEEAKDAIENAEGFLDVVRKIIG